MERLPAQHLLSNLANNSEIMLIGYDKATLAFESQLILSALERNHGNKIKAAIDLQMSLPRLNNYINKLRTRPKVVAKHHPAQIRLDLIDERKPVSSESAQYVDRLMNHSERLDKLNQMLANHRR